MLGTSLDQVSVRGLRRSVRRVADTRVGEMERVRCVARIPRQATWSGCHRCSESTRGYAGVRGQCSRGL